MNQDKIHGINEMPDGPIKKIGDILIEQRFITPTMLQQALDIQKSENKPLGKILVDMGYLSTEDLRSVLAKQFGSIYINPQTFSLRNTKLLQLIPEEDARKYICFPFDKNGDELTIVIEDPLDTEAISYLNTITKHRIKPVHSKKEIILEILNKYYKNEPDTVIKKDSKTSGPAEVISPSKEVKIDKTNEMQLSQSQNKMDEVKTEKIERPWQNDILNQQPLSEVKNQLEQIKPESKLPVPFLTFENFVVGSSNQLAWAAAQNVVSQPGIGFNPLFIYGGVGLGKTHLSNAIGNEIIQKYPKAKVCYISIDTFIRELIDAIECGGLNTFQNKYRMLDTLLIDDVQFLSDQERTQEEFFFVFEQLYRSNGQMVITSDRLPRQIDKLEDRLRTRFEGGLMVDIQAPDVETRIAIFRKKINQRGLDVSDDIINKISSRLPLNIRELEGVTNRILAQTKLMNEPISYELIKEILDTISPKADLKSQTPSSIITHPGVLPSEGFR